MKVLIYSILACIILLTSCTSNKNIVYLRGTENETFPIRDESLYKLQKKDLLYIKILSNNEAINKVYNFSYSENYVNASESYLYLYGYLVNDSGYVSLPNIGEILVTGLTVAEAKDKIETEASKYLQEFTVFVKLAYFKISILGEVNAPGLFPVFQDKINIFHALALAGDINDNGDKREVLIIRNTNENIQTFRLNLTKKELISSELYNIMPNDIIYVQPVKAKSLRIINAPTIQIMLQTLTTFVLVMSFVLNRL